MLNIRNEVLSKLPVPKNAIFGPEINTEHEDYGMEWDGPGWYGLFRQYGSEFYFWRKLYLSDRDEADIKNSPSATLSDIARSFGLNGYPKYVATI